MLEDIAAAVTLIEKKTPTYIYPPRYPPKKNLNLDQTPAIKSGKGFVDVQVKKRLGPPSKLLLLLGRVPIKSTKGSTANGRSLRPGQTTLGPKSS